MAKATTRGPLARRRWIASVVIVAILVIAAAAFTLVRPVAAVRLATRARLWAAGVRSDVALGGTYRIHYLVAGSGRPIVLLHGLAGSALQWSDYIIAFADDGRIYAPDLLGHGDSEQPDVDYSIRLQTETVRAFLDSVRAEQVDLVGVSMGGWIAADFARKYPGRVRRLVLADAGGLGFDPGAPAPVVPQDERDLPRLERLLGARSRLISSFAARDALRDITRHRWVVERFLRQRTTGRDFLDDKLGTVTMPVLLVWGERDMLSPLSRAEAFHRQIAQSELLILKGCGHAAIVDCRSAAQPAIRAFLMASRPAAGGRREIDVR